jgi:hypothetical protein
VAEKLKYNGITITCDLSWKTHTKNICGKAMKNIGFIRRVGPHLEYAARIRDHEQKDLTKELDKI